MAVRMERRIFKNPIGCRQYRKKEIYVSRFHVWMPYLTVVLFTGMCPGLFLSSPLSGGANNYESSNYVIGSKQERQIASLPPPNLPSLSGVNPGLMRMLLPPENADLSWTL